MTKRLPLLLLTGCLYGSMLFAQPHTASDFGFEVSGGATRYGWIAQAGAYTFFTDKIFARLNVSYNSEMSNSLPHKATGVVLMGGYTIWSNEKLFVSPLLGLTATSEQDVTDYNFNLLKYGGMAGVEVERILSDKLSLFANFQQYRFLPGKTTVTSSSSSSIQVNDVWGVSRWAATLGIRFHLTKGGGGGGSKYPSSLYRSSDRFD